MLTPPGKLDTRALAQFVQSRWQLSGLQSAQMTFCPVGKDSWNFRFGEYFVSLRRDLRGHVRNAYEALRELVESGQIAALAPLPSCKGSVVEQFQDTPVLMFQHVDHSTLETRSDHDNLRAAVLSRLHALHEAHTEIELPQEDFRLSFRESLLEVLERAEQPDMICGPLGKPAQTAIADAAPEIRGLLAEIETLGARCRSNPGRFVLTHGEPLPANIIETPQGSLHLIDFTELAFGPPERDLVHVAASFGWDISMRPEFEKFYTLKWQLSEIEEYGRFLFAPHVGNADDKEMLDQLRVYLPQAGQAA